MSASGDAPGDAPTAATTALPRGWREVVDAGSGRTYYWNERTQETQWERPPAAAATMPAPREPARRESTQVAAGEAATALGGAEDAPSGAQRFGPRALDGAASAPGAPSSRGESAMPALGAGFAALALLAAVL